MDVPKGTTTQLHYALSPHMLLTYMTVDCHGRCDVALFDGALYPLEHSFLAEVNLRGFWLEYRWSKFGVRWQLEVWGETSKFNKVRH